MDVTVAALQTALLDRIEEMDLGDPVRRDLLGDRDDEALARFGDDLGHRAALAASSRST